MKPKEMCLESPAAPQEHHACLAAPLARYRLNLYDHLQENLCRGHATCKLNVYQVASSTWPHPNFHCTSSRFCSDWETLHIFMSSRRSVAESSAAQDDYQAHQSWHAHWSGSCSMAVVTSKYIRAQGPRLPHGLHADDLNLKTAKSAHVPFESLSCFWIKWRG